MIQFVHHGDFSKTTKFLKRAMKPDLRFLNQYGEEGVRALSSATPTDSGKTASSWSYQIRKDNGRTIIEWTNSNVNKGVNVAIILQYGHGTRNGGWVQGIDYINPALRPVFDKIADKAWEEVIGK